MAKVCGMHTKFVTVNKDLAGERLSKVYSLFKKNKIDSINKEVEVYLGIRGYSLSALCRKTSKNYGLVTDVLNNNFIKLLGFETDYLTGAEIPQEEIAKVESTLDKKLRSKRIAKLTQAQSTETNAKPVTELLEISRKYIEKEGLKDIVSVLDQTELAELTNNLSYIVKALKPFS